jgi:hypothetical protein
MADARRSFTAFRLTEQERDEIQRNDTDWVLDPGTGVLEPEPTEELEPQVRPKPFQVPRQYFD